jgi:DNA-binding CsgD family transcriptional regulator
MLFRFEEETRARLTELEQRLAALEGEDNRRSARGRLSRLTESERRIVGLVVSGRTNDEVAKRLFLSPKTVEWSLTKVYRKLGVRSRTELAAKLGSGSPARRKAGETPGTPLGPGGTEDEPDGPLRFDRSLSGSQPEAEPEDGEESS